MASFDPLEVTLWKSARNPQPMVRRRIAFSRANFGIAHMQYAAAFPKEDTMQDLLEVGDSFRDAGE